ncbi:RNA polymerase sigma factor [Flavobacterium sp. NKUCC04_CG]|uniref:RNA polymerase sigma factor n=1 Tax=Flavobacterium sp. NKUCC04_CG TaxID=2842121 RepID=UPI001C5BEE43|nr:RNA polymerase sigma factor [Flavobacterium sp. NKUCC04_CG]MBW3518568.1 RNA polymerase sigma factor [Flavobacterium sp. NKUCC04_CG]
METINHHKIDSLIALCKVGDAKAQYEIYNRFYKAMYAIAYKMVNDRSLTEDILQESFLNAFLSMDQFKNEATFGTWLRKIVVNKCIDALNKKRKIILEDISTVLNTLIDENSKEDASDYEQFRTDQIVDIIYSLKGKSKIIIILYYIKGYGKREICDVMNIKLTNFHTIMFRAKKDLKRKMYVERNQIFYSDIAQERR